MPAHFHWLFAVAITASVPAFAQDQGPELAVVRTSTEVQFHIQSDKTPYVGVVIASLDSQLAHHFAALPPLLNDYRILGYGMSSSQGHFGLSLPKVAFPAGVAIHAQGVVVDAIGIRASKPRDFMSDVAVR